MKTLQEYLSEYVAISLYICGGKRYKTGEKLQIAQKTLRKYSDSICFQQKTEEDVRPLWEVKRDYVLEVYSNHNNHKGKTAKALGIHRRTLVDLLKKYESGFENEEKSEHSFESSGV